MKSEGSFARVATDSATEAAYSRLTRKANGVSFKSSCWHGQLWLLGPRRLQVNIIGIPSSDLIVCFGCHQLRCLARPCLDWPRACGCNALRMTALRTSACLTAAHSRTGCCKPTACLSTASSSHSCGKQPGFQAWHCSHTCYCSFLYASSCCSALSPSNSYELDRNWPGQC